MKPCFSPVQGPEAVEPRWTLKVPPLVAIPVNSAVDLLPVVVSIAFSSLLRMVTVPEVTTLAQARRLGLQTAEC
jgi:hypothetical protein